jgi:zinc transport system substrate-binding protein
MLKKKSAFAMILVIILLSICSFAHAQTVKAKQLNVLCSFHPIYVFTQNVAMNISNVTVDCLLPPNISPHDYALTPGDMKKIAKANIFIVNGLGLEQFLDKAIKQGNQGIKVVDTSAGIKPIKTEGAGKSNEPGIYNPHIWVSPKSAIIQVRNIEKALTQADPVNAKLYKANADKYAAKLQVIVNDLTNASKTFKNRKIVTFHNAFDYFAQDFNLQVVGVIEVVAGHEPSAGELAKMVKQVKESGAGAVFSEPQYSDKVAKVLANEAKVPVYQLDPAHTGDGKPDAYEKIMRKNLETLKKAL